MDGYQNYLNDKVNEYHELYVLSKKLSNYQSSYLQNVPSYGFSSYCETFQRNVNSQLERCSLNIRKHLVSNQEHSDRLKKIQKELKCGFIQYLFKSQYRDRYKQASLFKEKHLPDNVHACILSFLDIRDNMSVRFASIYENRELVEASLKSMTLASLKKLPHIFNAMHYYQHLGEESKRPLKKILKSHTKNAMIESLLDNLDNIYQNFRGNTITLQVLQQRYASHITIDTEWAYDRMCQVNKYSIYFDPYYITNRYMIACSKVLLVLRMYSKHKQSKKKKPSVVKKKGVRKASKKQIKR
jgi:hypothetical protein